MAASAIRTAADLAAVRPTDRQLRWQSLEFYAFIHFGMNTMTGREWGLGDESPSAFDPANLDADQWMSALARAGMKGAILTAKHHDGFCLWPSRLTQHSVAASPWQGGQGDVVAEAASAAERHGLAFGIYLSPWDRSEASYGTGEPYNDFFVAQLEELLTNYGKLFSVWFDGANGEAADGRQQVYDWERYYATIRKLQPDAVINVCGPDVRWCGNEAGHTRQDEWSVVPRTLQDTERIANQSQHVDDGTFARLVRSNEEDLGSRAALAGYDDLIWYPAEVNTSIRPGWFYHQAEDGRVRNVAELFSIYRSSVGGNSTFLLNVPPTPHGLLAAPDVATLAELGDMISGLRDRTIGAEISFSSGAVVEGATQQSVARRWGSHLPPDPTLDLANGTGWWQPDEDDAAASITVNLGSDTVVEALILKEEISLGQRLEHVVVSGHRDGATAILAEATCVGYQRILTFPPANVDAVTVEFRQARDTPAIAGLRLVRAG